MQLLEEQDEFRVQALMDSGINMDDPAFAEHFSVSSMESFLDCRTCLFENLVETMDGYRPNQPGCSNCSACNPDTQQTLSTAWTVALDEIAEEGSIDDEDDNAEDPNQAALQEAASRQQVVDEIQQQRQFLCDWVWNLRSDRCLWHPYNDVNHRGCSQLFTCYDDYANCMEPLYTLLGHRLPNEISTDRRRICCACGDKMINTRGRWLCVSGNETNPCSYQSARDLNRPQTRMCTYCCFADCDQTHCPKQKAWFLVILAFRNDGVYDAVKTEYTNLARTQDYPSQTCFLAEMEGHGAVVFQRNRENWGRSLHWLMDNEQRNLWFWSAIRNASTQQNIFHPPFARVII